jgi:hypothetical protein
VRLGARGTLRDPVGECHTLLLSNEERVKVGSEMEAQQYNEDTEIYKGV